MDMYWVAVGEGHGVLCYDSVDADESYYSRWQLNSGFQVSTYWFIFASDA